MRVASPESNPEFAQKTVPVFVVAALIKPGGSKQAEVLKGIWLEGGYILSRLDRPTPIKHLNWALGKGSDREIADWVIPIAEAEVPSEVYDAVVRGDFTAIEKLAEIPFLSEDQERLFAEAQEELVLARDAQRIYKDWRTEPEELWDELM